MSTEYFNALCRAISITCAAALIGSLAPPAFASIVNDNSLFELDTPVANTVDSNCPNGPCNTNPSADSDLPDDWNDLGANGTSTDAVKKGSSHADVSTGIISDTVAHVFSKGSKDEADISTWDYRVGSSPAKADMTHAYALGYNHDSAGEKIPLVLFFGSNRGSFNGTTELGYWFFKNKIVQDDATKTFKNAAGTGPAHHCDGDLLVTVAYDNGGKVGTIRVRKWTDASGSGACSGSGTLTDVDNSTNTSGISGRYCNGSETVCAGSNSSTITLPWAPGEGSSGQFLEGGLNVFGLTGESPCFASFMATSRSSSTTRSETKNFILRDFPVCKLDVTKACEFKELVTNNQARFTVNGVVTNSGGGSLSNITVTDVPALEANSLGYFACDVNGKPTGSPIANPSLDPGGTLCYQATVVGAEGQQTQNDTITAHGSSGGATIDSSGAPATCSVSFPGLPTLTKSCVSCLDDTTVTGMVILETSYSGEICNTNSFTFTNVTVKDLAIGTDTSASTAGIVIAGGRTNGSFTLGAGTESNPTCIGYTGKYFPAHALDRASAIPIQPGDPPLRTTLNPDRADFRDSIQVTGTRPFGSANEVLANQPAKCDLCINPTTPLGRCGG